MANKLSKDISGSVHEKRGMLYLVVSYKDTVTKPNGWVLDCLQDPRNRSSTRLSERRRTSLKASTSASLTATTIRPNILFCNS